MVYGQELINRLEQEVALNKKAISDRIDRINQGLTDIDDCFISQRCEERGIRNAEDKIRLIKDGGCSWFREYATLDGTLVDAHWCNTKYGSSPELCGQLPQLPRDLPRKVSRQLSASDPHGSSSVQGMEECLGSTVAVMSCFPLM